MGVNTRHFEEYPCMFLGSVDPFDGGPEPVPFAPERGVWTVVHQHDGCGCKQSLLKGFFFPVDTCDEPGITKSLADLAEWIGTDTLIAGCTGLSHLYALQQHLKAIGPFSIEKPDDYGRSSEALVICDALTLGPWIAEHFRFQCGTSDGRLSDLAKFTFRDLPQIADQLGEGHYPDYYDKGCIQEDCRARVKAAYVYMNSD